MPLSTKTAAITVFLTFFIFHKNLGQDYRKYHLLINKAELLLVDSLYEKALYTYDSIFTHAPYKPFAKDYYNAAVCTALLKRYKTTGNYISKLFLKGIVPDTIEMDKNFAAYITTRYWKGLKKKYPEYLKQSSINWWYRAQMDSIYYHDQHFRLLVPGGTSIHMSVYGDTIRKLDSLNNIVFRHLVDSLGFPGEDKIGVKSLFDKPAYFTFLLHRYQGGGYRRVNHDYTPTLRQAIIDGNIHPKLVAELENQSSTPPYYTAIYWIYEDTTVKKLCPKAQIKMYDNFHAMLGLERVEDYNKKVSFEWTHPKKFCFGTVFLSYRLYGMTYKEYLNELKESGKRKRN